MGEIQFKIENDRNIIFTKVHSCHQNKSGIESELSFSYDHVFDQSRDQNHIFDVVARPITKGVLEGSNELLSGFNGTIIAYGQTSSGKTYTMEGSEQTPGVIPRVVDALFECIEESPETVEFELKVSMMEIYKEEIKDLLDINNKNLKIRSEKLSGVVEPHSDLRREPDHSIRRLSQRDQRDPLHRQQEQNRRQNQHERAVFQVAPHRHLRADTNQHHRFLGSLP